MGDRGIAVLKFSDQYGADLALYSHWTGSTLFDDVTDIVKSSEFQNRLAMGDETYEARILIDQLTKDARDDETGYGLFPLVVGADASFLSDGQVEVVIDLAKGTVTR